MRYGLNDATVEKLRSVLASYPQIEQAILYGSRAKGNYKNGSDIDLTLQGGDDLTFDVLYEIIQQVDDLLLPYTVDLSIFSTLSDEDLIDHIRRLGVVFYQRAARKDTEKS